MSEYETAPAFLASVNLVKTNSECEADVNLEPISEAWLSI